MGKWPTVNDEGNVWRDVPRIKRISVCYHPAELTERGRDVTQHVSTHQLSGSLGPQPDGKPKIGGRLGVDTRRLSQGVSFMDNNRL